MPSPHLRCRRDSTKPSRRVASSRVGRCEFAINFSLSVIAAVTDRRPVMFLILVTSPQCGSEVLWWACLSVCLSVRNLSWVSRGVRRTRAVDTVIPPSHSCLLCLQCMSITRDSCITYNWKAVAGGRRRVDFTFGELAYSARRRFAWTCYAHTWLLCCVHTAPV